MVHLQKCESMARIRSSTSPFSGAFPRELWPDIYKYMQQCANIEAYVPECSTSDWGQTTFIIQVRVHKLLYGTRYSIAPLVRNLKWNVRLNPYSAEHKGGRLLEALYRRRARMLHLNFQTFLRKISQVCLLTRGPILYALETGLHIHRLALKTLIPC